MSMYMYMDMDDYYYVTTSIVIEQDVENPLNSLSGSHKHNSNNNTDKQSLVQ